MTGSVPRGDTAAAIALLAAWHPDRLRVVTAISPEKRGAFSATFEPGQEVALARWIESRQGRDNLYYTPNTVGQPFDGYTKPTKPDIVAAVCLHVDVDPRKGEPLEVEQARILTVLRAYRFRPSAIVFSGGGYQAFWRLKEPFALNGDESRIKKLESYNRQIAADLGGDDTFNVDRILRLPGTVNVPDARKRARGRVPTLAELLP